jgi:hypothetical protein
LSTRSLTSTIRESKKSPSATYSLPSWVDILYAPDFYARHDEFWITHSEFEDWTRIDLRWFALFHTILAIGSLLDDGPDLDLAERQAISDKCFVAARRALGEAPSVYGESLDTVAAYTLVSVESGGKLTPALAVSCCHAAHARVVAYGRQRRACGAGAGVGKKLLLPY